MYEILLVTFTSFILFVVGAEVAETLLNKNNKVFEFEFMTY